MERGFIVGIAVAIVVPACTGGDGRDPAGPGLSGESEGCVTPSGDPCEVPECDDPCGYNDAGTLLDTECRITGTPAECNDVRGIEVTFQQQGATVAAPGGFFKPSDPSLLKWIEARWQEQADFVIPDPVKQKLTQGGVKIWNYPDGNGWIRADFHGGIMALPKGQTPEALLRSMANDVISATGNDELAGWVAWPASENRQVGDRVDLDIWGPDNGAVGYWKIDADRFCVITLENDSVGAHPVNGIRCWGFVPMAINPNWMTLPENAAKWGCAGPTYMFYTIGLDSPSVAGGGGVGSDLQAGTWNALIRDLLRQNDKAGGVSGRYYSQITVAQPNALKPKSGVKVTGPGELDSYYVTLPSDGYREGEVCMDPGPGGPAGACAEGDFTCASGACLPAEQRCDGTAQCPDRDDEDACDEPDENGCPANQFACDDGTCVPEDWRCDGEYVDCSGGEDEAGCDASDTGCTGDEFTCGDGECVPGEWKCDGIVDCGDEADESGCGEDDAGCGAGEYACSDGECITASWECDGIVDCSDGADEAGCEPEAPTCDGFTCDDGECIAASWECDEIVDCSGGEDEAGCDGGGGSTCGTDEYACTDGTCIPASWECDDYLDCAEGEDEAWC